MDIGFNGRITGGTKPATFSQPRIANVSGFLEQRKRLVAEHWNTVAKIGGMIASSGQAAGNILSTVDAKREQRVENDYRTDFSTMKMKYANGLSQIDNQLATEDFENPEDYRAEWQKRSADLWFSLRDEAEKNGTFRRWNKWGPSDRLKNDMELVSLAAEEQSANSWLSGWRRRQRQAVESNAQDAIALGITDYDQFLEIYQRDATMTPSEQKLAAEQATKKSTIQAATNMISAVAASTYTQEFWDNQNQLLRTGQYEQVEKNQQEADKKIDETLERAKKLVGQGFSPFTSTDGSTNLEEERRAQVAKQQQDSVQSGLSGIASQAKGSAGERTQKAVAVARKEQDAQETARVKDVLAQLAEKSKLAAAATDREMKTKYNTDTAKELAKWRDTGEAPTSDLGLTVVALAPDGTEGQDYVFKEAVNEDGSITSTETILTGFNISAKELSGLSQEERGASIRKYAYLSLLDDIYSYSDSTPSGIERMSNVFAEAKKILSPNQYRVAWGEWMSQVGAGQDMKVNALWRDHALETLKKDVLGVVNGGKIKKSVDADWKNLAMENDDLADLYAIYAGAIKRAKTQEAAEVSVLGAKNQLLALAQTKKEQRDTKKLVERALGWDGADLFARKDEERTYIPATELERRKKEKEEKMQQAKKRAAQRQQESRKREEAQRLRAQATTAQEKKAAILKQLASGGGTAQDLLDVVVGIQLPEKEQR